MNANKITISYVDDQADLSLNAFLENFCEKTSRNYFFVKVMPENTLNDVIEKIKEKQCDVLILDSKLYRDSDAGNKITGEELEMLLVKRLQFVSTILITQQDSFGTLKCLRKYKSTIADREDTSEQYYEKELTQLLEVECNKMERFYGESIRKLNQNDRIDKMELENMLSLLNSKEPEVSLTKNDVDRIIDSFNKLSEDFNDL